MPYKQTRFHGVISFTTLQMLEALFDVLDDNQEIKDEILSKMPEGDKEEILHYLGEPYDDDE